MCFSSCQGSSCFATLFATFEEHLCQTSSVRQVVPLGSPSPPGTERLAEYGMIMTHMIISIMMVLIMLRMMLRMSIILTILMLTIRWKPHRDCCGSKKPVAGLDLVAYARNTEGHGFIEVEISNSTTGVCEKNTSRE